MQAWLTVTNVTRDDVALCVGDVASPHEVAEVTGIASHSADTRHIATEAVRRIRYRVRRQYSAVLRLWWRLRG